MGSADWVKDEILGSQSCSLVLSQFLGGDHKTRQANLSIWVVHWNVGSAKYLKHWS